jgi:putative FmdB family regulatory protein
VPIYEYECKSCHARFEKLVKSMNSKAKVACPECGSKQTERALSVFAVNSESGGARGERPPMCEGCSGEGPCPMAD